MNVLDSTDPLEGIAVIGMAGRFPRARNLAEFWQNLRDGVEATSFFSDEELLAAGVAPDVLRQPEYVKARAILEEAEWFDAPFFGLGAREAEIIDPQHRLFLECAWETLEDAGYDPESYTGLVGVYGGTSMNTYLLNNLASNPELLEMIGDYQTMLGNDKDFLTTRVSYKLNLKGPSVNVQTACSTSLVAVVLACQSLLSYQCDMALAGGVSVMFPQKKGHFYREGGIHSPDGRCRAFDAEARGMFAGQGVGMVALKRLEEAVADGDHIYAVIKGSAVNNDGSLKVGYTAPSVEGQAEVITLAQALAGVEPESISYVEAHGTATPLGDVVEMGGLSQAFDTGSGATGYCAIGSVKTNIGHLDAAAGVAGLIKTALALKYKTLPPSLHFKRPNPQIEFANSPFYVNTAASEWQAQETPRRAGVSSFGIGGTNAHLVLEEAPALPPSSAGRPWKLLVLSAKTEGALERATGNLAAHLQTHPDLNLADVAYTLQLGRRAFPYRRIAICRDTADGAQVLGQGDPNRLFNGTHDPAAGNSPVVFMFTGQGAQYVNMGRELYESEPQFREQVDACCDFLKAHLGVDLRAILYPAPGASEAQLEAAAEQLRQTNMTQPALFVIEYALAQLWMSWGVQPRALIGHSIGEYVAACLAGVFALEDALALVARRGQLMHELPAGGMVVVHQTEERLRSLVDAPLSLAVVNGPSLCVVSGPLEAVAALESRLAERDIDYRRLQTSHAFHSPMMEPILERFQAEVAQVSLNPPEIPFVSNVSGTWITAEEATNPAYWSRHLRETVRFGDGLRTLLQEPRSILLEVGPGSTLSSLARQLPERARDQLALSSMRHPKEEESDLAVLFTTAGRLWLGGAAIDWQALYAGENRRRISLPTYPFERQRYWVEPRRAQAGKPPAADVVKRADLAQWSYIPVWRREAVPAGGQKTRAIEKRRWLVFAGEQSLDQRLVERLHQMGQQVILVRAGESFDRRSRGEYVLNRRQPGDYETLLETVWAAQQVPDVILHLWSLESAAEDGQALAGLEQTEAAGFYSLLFLAQALGRRNITDPLPIQVVTNETQLVTGEERVRPEKATVLGPSRVVPLEYPSLRFYTVDITLPAAGTPEEERLLELLLGEATFRAGSPKQQEPVVALRSGERWTQRFEPFPLEDVGSSPLREGGVYLITGGLGGIGLILAEFLAEKVQAKLVLTGRTALPGREEWEQLLETEDEQSRLAGQIRAVLALEALGAEVLVAAADVTDLEQMAAVVASACERFGTVHGVIHAAGIAGGGIVALRSAEQAAAVLAPKVRGTLVLQKVLEPLAPDLFVLCSSINAVQPVPGQVDYCAANAFLDAFAHSLDGRNGTRYVSINWDTWQQVGMAVNTEVPEQLRSHREHNLKHGIRNSEGQLLFRRIVAQPGPQVLISTRDWQQRNAPQPVVKGFDLLEALEPAASTNGSPPPAGLSYHARPNLQTAYVAPRTGLEKQMAQIWQQLLSVEKVGIHDNFFDLGGSSLLALRLFAQIEKLVGQKLPLAALFQAQTVAELCARLEPGEKRTGWSPLVAVQEGSGGPPIFFIHAAGGNVLVYRDLARHLGPQQTVYGLQSPGMDGEQPLLTRIEEMASLYVDEILQVQPDGPYLLAGYCMGGTVALEIAQQLSQRGKEVALLALLETYNWGDMRRDSVPVFATFFLQKAIFHWHNFWALNRKEKAIFVQEKMKVLRGRTRVWQAMLRSRLRHGETQELQLQLRPGEIWEANDRAALNYRASTYNGEITHLCPLREYSRYSGPELKWDQLAPKVNSHVLPVYPGGMLVEPFVSETARVLRQQIACALNERSSPQVETMELLKNVISP